MLDQSIAVIGMGYVGLPLAIRLAQQGFEVTGVDTNEQVIETLCKGESPNPDINKSVFPIQGNFVAQTEMPGQCDVYIVCVPTPHVKNTYAMDPSYVLAACEAVGAAMPHSATVVIESTVTPGTTEGIFKEAVANAKGDACFNIAFSPERVNPGSHYFDSMFRMEKLIGAENGCVDTLRDLYGKIFQGVQVVGIKEAELAKTFENAQRDLCIALMNELSMLCYERGLDFAQVVKGLRTKTTSPVFTSGMVGGHCIPVDSYFLGEFYDDMDCLSMRGRELNESYILYVGDTAIDCKHICGPIVILGRSYKSGVVDTRNSGSVKLYDYIHSQGREVLIHEPLTQPTYDGRPPAVLIGAVNHYPMSDIYRHCNCDIATTFINTGGRFSDKQVADFTKVIDL